ncbi:MAG: helix-turn-helix transcriptional regulator [Eubacterium sp.]|nr:helix-turn-helix transcriptional regulator [Eubacterium sp.]
MNISKQEASRRIGVSQPAYLRYESGEREPSLHVIKDIARVFNTSVDYLTGKTDSPEPDSITINKKDNPVLFSIVESYENWDEAQIKRLTAYAKKINEMNKEHI